MRNLLLPLLLLLATTMHAEIYTIAFNYSETGSDGTGATTDVAKLIKSSNYDFVSSIDAANTNNVYVGKYGYGMKGGTGTIGGKVTLLLDTTYTVRTLTLYAAAANKGDTAATKGIKVCGQTICWRSPRMELQPYDITLNAAIDRITIEALTAKNCRFYVEHIELDIEDTYSYRGKIKMPAKTFKFASMEYNTDAPAEDEETFEIAASGITAQGLTLTMKTGTTFQVTPSQLPAEGGEFSISYSTHAAASYDPISDTCIISATGLNGLSITRRMGVSTMVYAARPYVVDSTDMVISIAPTTDYYSAIDGKQDSLLKSTLGAIINSGHRYKYGSGNHRTWAGFFYTDRDTLNQRVLDMYSQEDHYFNIDRPTASVSGFDIEHMLPKSWWGRIDNDAYKDLFHLVPGNASANRSKSNHAPGIPTDTTFWNGSFATGPDTVRHLSHVFCPADEYKGDFARAYFYIACCYGDSLTWVEEEGSEPATAMTNDSWQEFRPWLRDLLLDWHRNDPVSDKEKARAIEVNKIQGNRNPFIDYPDLVEYIWGEHQGEPLDLSTLTCTYPNTPTRLDNNTTCDAIIVLRNGQILIVRDGNYYTVSGTKLHD